MASDAALRDRGPGRRVEAARVADLVRRLVAVDSINPMLVPGAPGERAIAELLAAECRGAGLEVRVDEVQPGRWNTTAWLRGASPGGRCLLLNGHIDTVDVDAMRAAGVDPFAGRFDRDRVYGRGAYDMKAGVAAMVEAARAVAAAGLGTGEMILTFVCDEEYASIGTADVVRRLAAAGARRPDAAIVTEPTALDICVAHKGFVWARFVTVGRSAHGSRHEDGEDAIVRMGRVLVELERLDREVLPRRRHPLLGRPSIHASPVRGGLGLSTYPDRCELDVERRTLPGEGDDAIASELAAVLDAARAAAPNLGGSVELLLSRPPFEIDPGQPVVEVLVDVARAERGVAPRIVGQAPWFDAALLGAAGIPTVMFGPDGAGAHAADEWADLPSTVSCARALANVADAFCGRT
jgi:acetylornithine deacetylase